MVSVKGKLSIPLSQVEDRVTQKNAGVKEFKVYVEKEMAEVSSSGSDGTKEMRKSVTFNERSTQTMTNNLKGGAKVSENRKGKRDSSINVGRRALADVSNLRGNSLKTKGQDGRNQLITVKKAPTVIRKSLLASNTVSKVDTSREEKGKMKGSHRSVVAVHSFLKRGSRDFKPSISDQLSHIQGDKCLNTDGRINSMKTLPLSRKSLPVSKLPRQADIGNKKELGDNTEKGTSRIHGYPGKAKVGQKVIPQVKNARAHLWRTRVSDGFIIMDSKNQSAVNGRAFSRKSLKPIVKTTYGSSSAKVSLKLKDKEVASTFGNSRAFSRKSIKPIVKPTYETSSAKVSLRSREKEVASTSGHGTTVKDSQSLVEASSDWNSNTSISKLEKYASKSTRRRKSFTSLLMGSKVHNERGQCLEQKLPNIYDDDNHIEVPEYVDEIYQYYWTMEAQGNSLENYMEMQTEITPQMRDILVNWLIEVHMKFDLMPETLYLTITLLDRFLSLVTIEKNELQLVGLTAVLLASKYEDFWHPRVSDLISIAVDSYTRDQMLDMEKAFLKNLKFRLNAPTPYVFMLRFLKASKSDKKLEDLSFYLIDLCMVHYEALHFKVSLLCASAIFVARCTLQMTPSWSPLLCIYSHHKESQLRDCAEMVLKFQKSAKTSRLKVTYEKYSKPEHNQVANIKPLNKLPFN